MATFRLKIVRSGQEFEAEGDKAFVLEMLKRFEQAQPTRDTAEDAALDLRPGETPTPQPIKGTSLREFVRHLGFKRHTDILVAFAYYLEKYSGVSQFTPADINNCYYEAKMEASNTSQSIIQNIKRGFVMEAKGGAKARRRYTITATGERFVDERLGHIRE